MMKLSESIEEEFDMMELIEDEIKDLFACDLNCVTCSDEDRGECMQKFKKANLYWIRKVVQDERMIKEVADKMNEMKENLLELADALKVSLKMAKAKKEKDKEVKTDDEATKLPGYFT
jgi:hypothetical protein